MPASPVKRGLINFILGGGIDYLSLARVDQWRREGNLDELARHFQDAVVVLGNVTAFRDRRPLPVRLFAPEADQTGLRQPGVVAHLQAYRTFQAGRVIPAAPAVAGRFDRATGLAGLVVRQANRFPWRYAWDSAGRSSCLWTPGCCARVPTCPQAAALVMLMLGAGGRMLFESIRAMAERRRLRTLFAGYVSPQVLDSILLGELAFDRSGELRRVCVLFSDIRSFTSRSEEQRPEAVIALLNRYFDHMVDCIHGRGGTVDKFMGDGLMAFFGAPNGVGSPAGIGMDCAIAMLTRLDQLNAELLREGIEPIRIGIGLHVGDVVVGHVGATGRHEYTAIGDAVNVAARLEELSKELGSSHRDQPTDGRRTDR